MMLSHAAEDARLAPPPEITLATAVLNRAVEDLSWGFATAAQAAIWLTSDSTEPYSALSLCDALGIDHGSIVAHVHRTWPRHHQHHWSEYRQQADGKSARDLVVTKDMLLAWQAEGLSALQAARRADIPVSTIRSATYRHNLPLDRAKNGNPVDPAHRWYAARPEFDRRILAGESVMDVTRDLGIEIKSTHYERARKLTAGVTKPLVTEEQLRDWSAKGYTPADVLAATGRHHWEVRRAEAQYGIRLARVKRGWQACAAEFTRRVLSGEQVSEIIQALGLRKRSSVYAAAKEIRVAAGLQVESPPETVTKEDLLAWHDAGVPVSQAARQTGVSVSVVINAERRHGIVLRRLRGAQ